MGIAKASRGEKAGERLQLLEGVENAGPGHPQFLFCMSVQEAGGGLLRDHSSRLSECGPQKHLFAIRLYRPPPADLTVVGVVIQIVLQRGQSALSGGPSSRPGGDTATIDSGNVVNAIAIATQSQDHGDDVKQDVAGEQRASRRSQTATLWGTFWWAGFEAGIGRCPASSEAGVYTSTGGNALGDFTVSDKQTNTWPDLLIGLYDNLTGRRAEITYEFDNMHIKIPSGTGSSAEHAEWVLHGTMKIRTRDTGTSPN